MKAAYPYLTFDGNCAEAMAFYAAIFHVKVESMPFADMPDAPPAAAGAPARVMHAHFAAGPFVLMASDTMPGQPWTLGSNISISLDCESREEVDRLYAAFSDGGRSTMSPQDTFWNAYFAMTLDRFGVAWMFNHDHAPAQTAQ